MKKRLLIGIILLLSLGALVGTAAQSAGAANKKPDFSGIYEVQVTTAEGQIQSGQITIEDRGNGEVQANYNYQGSPFGLVGEVSGDPEEGGALCRFTINYPGVVKADAEMTIIKVDDNYQLRGYGEGDYNYQGQSGHIAGQVTGRRVSPLAAPSQFPLLIIAAVAGLVILAVAIASGINVLRR